MAWIFFVAPDGYQFITSDDPVFNNGPKNQYAEISFPISKEIVLVLTWLNVKEGFYAATPSIVEEINLRTANNSRNEVFSSRPESKFVTLIAFL